jgi:predicted lactoylglutathione lyase|tara:strand:+ start:207 stop:1052 length:846 start_codon:yes stop_codon:yes gene_type:complete
MLTGDLKDQNIRIVVGVPMYGGMLSESTFHSLLALHQWCLTQSIEIKINTIGNESLISRARNTLVTMFLDDLNFIGTHFLFVDADIGFTTNNIDRLIRADKDVACGIYPRKCIHWNQVIDAMKENPNISEEELSYKALGYNLNFEDNQNIQIQNGFAKVLEAATGMMLIKRDVFKRMKKAYPERKYKPDQIINGDQFSSSNCYDFFGVGKLEGDEEERYLSEDYYFSRLWSRINGNIWADLASPLTHHGNMHFKGHVGAMFSTKNDINTDKTQTGNSKTDQ